MCRAHCTCQASPLAPAPCTRSGSGMSCTLMCVHVARRWPHGTTASMFCAALLSSSSSSPSSSSSTSSSDATAIAETDADRYRRPGVLSARLPMAGFALCQMRRSTHLKMIIAHCIELCNEALFISRWAACSTPLPPSFTRAACNEPSSASASADALRERARRPQCWECLCSVQRMGTQ